MVETRAKGKTWWHRTVIPSIPEAEGEDQALDVNQSGCHSEILSQKTKDRQVAHY